MWIIDVTIHNCQSPGQQSNHRGAWAPKIVIMAHRYQPNVIKNQIVPIVRQVGRESGAVFVDVFTPLSGHVQKAILAHR
jgi:hypothetical protein